MEPSAYFNGQQQNSQILEKRAGRPLSPEYYDSMRMGSTMTRERQQCRLPCGDKKRNFPGKLHDMLENIDGTNYTSIVSWVGPQGQAFQIHNRKLFEDKILPLYFNRQRNFTSFQRQLNLYGFQRLPPNDDNDGGGGVVYYHDNFVRGRPDLCVHISRNAFGLKSSATTSTLDQMPRDLDDTTVLPLDDPSSKDASSPSLVSLSQRGARLLDQYNNCSHRISEGITTIRDEMRVPDCVQTRPNFPTSHDVETGYVEAKCMAAELNYQIDNCALLEPLRMFAPGMSASHMLCHDDDDEYYTTSRCGEI